MSTYINKMIHREATQFAEQFSIPWDDPKNSSIASLSREAYLPPIFLKDIVSPDQYEEFVALMDELWLVNEEHVGDRIMEVQLYVALTRRYELLERSITQWLLTYCEKRIVKWNPKDLDSNLVKFCRLLEEMSSILWGKRESSTDTLILDRPFTQAAWYLYEHTWKNEADELEDDSKSRNSELAKIVASLKQNFGFGRDNLGDFLSRVQSGIPPQLSKLRDCSEEQLSRDIDILISGILQMRPFLIHNFDQEKSIIPLTNDLWIYVKWISYHNIVRIITGPTREAIAQDIVRGSTANAVLQISVRGLLVDDNRPWITTADLGKNALAVNVFVLQAVHDLIFKFYDQIDFEAIRASDRDELEETREEELLALSLQDLANDSENHALGENDSENDTLGENDRENHTLGEEVKDNIKIRLRPLRLEKLLNILDKEFGCEVRSGKGDETAVYRPGARIYSFGQLKEVYPLLLKQVLKRLNITSRMWLDAVS